MAAGLVTGLLHTFMGIPAILAGILTQLALWSINLTHHGHEGQPGHQRGQVSDLLVSLRCQTSKESAL